MRVLFAVAAALLAANLSAQQNVETNPTAAEQTFMYEVNRARSNPPAYGQERGYPGLTSSITPSRPLALNRRLVTSSRFHSDEMAQYGYFAHTSAVTGQQPNQMVRNAGYPLATYLPNAANNVESLAARGATSYDPVDAVSNLIEDVGVNPPGHRYHLLAWGGEQSTIDFYRQFREAGAGYDSGLGWSGSGSGSYWSFHTGFRDLTNHAFITGVVYNDANTNTKYDSGEGLSGVSVKLYNWNSQALLETVTTTVGGGYVFQVNNGTFVLEVSGGSFTGTRWAKLTVSSYANMQVDFRSDSSFADINFGAWGALPDSASVDGSQQPAPPATGGGGGGGGGTGGGGGGSVGGTAPGTEQVNWGDSQGCAASNSGTAWLALMGMIAALMACASARRAARN
jgi:uncharacterized protein YkwD